MQHDRLLFDLADWLTDPPAGGPIQMWVGGWGVGIVVTAYGLICCMTQRATTINITMHGFQSLGHGFWLDLAGAHAFTFGLVIACTGLFIHFHWFWGNHKRLFPFHEIAKCVAATGIVLATMAHLFTMITRT